jgi:hypothetical protein
MAKAHENNEEYLVNTKRQYGPGGDPKCNCFVSDMKVYARYLVFGTWERGMVSKDDVPWIPRAFNWSDERIRSLNGWEVIPIADAAPEDIIAKGPSIDGIRIPTFASGHVGIIVDVKKTASASSPLNGRIVVNDWGFRGNECSNFEKLVVRRYKPHVNPQK